MVALPFIMMGMSAAGTAMSVKGQLDAAKFQGQVADRNATLTERAATDASARGAAEAGLARMKGSQVVGQARAAAGGTGLDLSGGNVLDSIGATRLMSEMDVQTIKNNALREALGFKAQGDNFRLQGEGARAAGANGALSTLIGGTGQLFNMGYVSDLFPKLGK